MSELDHWQRFWKDRNVAGHSHDEAEHYTSHGNELKVLFGARAPQAVLEIGCGDGVLFDHLGFAQAREYRGVDFSEAMLDVFRQRRPGVSLVCGSGHSYRDDRKYDLIFCSQVVQYFNPAMLDEYFGNAAAMLAEGGRVVCASVPWRPLRRRYLMGQFSSRKRSAAWSLMHYARHLKSDSMGHWYDWQDLQRPAAAHGFVAKFYGSLYYPYRFHAVLQRGAGARTDA